MTDQNTIAGLILTLQRDGTIASVIRDDLSLFDTNPHTLPFSQYIDPSNINSFFRFLDGVWHESACRDMSISVKGRYWSGQLHITAIVQDTRIWIAGSPVREWVNQIFEEAVTISRSSTVSETSDIGSNDQMSVDIYEELTKITNELVNTQRELTSLNTQLEREKRELKEKEELYRTLFEAMEQGVVYQDADGFILSANRAAEKILGLTLDQMQGRTSSDPRWIAIRKDGSLFPGEEHPAMVSLKTGRPVKDVLMGIFHPEDEDFRWILIDATPKFHEGEEGPYQVFTVFTDVTRQRKLKRRLKEKTEYLEKLIQGANAPIIVWDDNLVITEFNDAFAELTGISAKDAIGRKISILFPEKSLEYSLDLIQKAASGDEWRVVEIPILGREGDIRTVLWNSANITVELNDRLLTTTIAQGQDITRRKQAEDSMRQLNRQLNLMTSITRHDILNKVNVVQILCRLIKDFPDSPKILEYIDDIEEATNIIEQQIDFTRIYQELGSQEPTWQRVIPIISSLYTPENFELVLTLDDLIIYADLLLEKVFYNLLDNSLRHGQTVDRIEIASEITDEGLKIFWKDNGVGIPEEEKEVIFDRGFGKNTGLGLFFIRDVLSLTGITIREVGRPGDGAMFEISVPNNSFRLCLSKGEDPGTC